MNVFNQILCTRHSSIKFVQFAMEVDSDENNDHWMRTR